jgi:hypothetical protein
MTGPERGDAATFGKGARAGAGRAPCWRGARSDASSPGKQRGRRLFALARDSAASLARDRRPDLILGCCNQNLSLSESARPPVARGQGGDSEPGGTGLDGRAGQPGRLLATGASPCPGPPALYLIRPSPACQPPLATSRRAADVDPGHCRDVCGGRLSSSGGARPPGPLRLPGSKSAVTASASPGGRAWHRAAPEITQARFSLPVYRRVQVLPESAARLCLVAVTILVTGADSEWERRQRRPPAL